MVYLQDYFTFHLSNVDFAKAHHSSMEMMWSAYDFIERYCYLYRRKICSLLVLMLFRKYEDLVPLRWRLPHRNFIDDIVTLLISLLIFQPWMCPQFILLTPLLSRNRMRGFSAKNRLVFLISSGILVSYTIWNGIKGNIHVEDTDLNMIIFFICFPVETLPNFISPPPQADYDHPAVYSHPSMHCLIARQWWILSMAYR